MSGEWDAQNANCILCRSLYVLLAACNARALVISSIPSCGLLQRPLRWHHLPSDFLGVDAIPVEVATEMFVER